NQMLATIALCVATSAMIRQGKARYAWVTLTPLLWLVAVTMTAGWEKLLSPAANIGFLAHAAVLQAELTRGGTSAARAAEIARLIWNDRVDAIMTAVFIITVVVVLGDSLRLWTRLLLGAGSRNGKLEEAAA
ncbi:MAG TPA: carbon starvation CstA 5TM domain-containing protein, partial [Candidatus Binataceae bacterium]|nr:carbon starvation CstA 5TM domain-containing protein [Candidatus Binataceae bacterium]